MVLSSSYAGLSQVSPGENKIGNSWHSIADDFQNARQLLSDKLEEENLDIETASLAIEGEEYLLHPREAFDEAMQEKLLEFHTGKSFEETSVDMLLQASAAGIYPAMDNNLQSILRQVPQVEVIHQASVFAESLARIEYGSDDVRLFIFPTGINCRIAIFHSGKMLFSNSFKADNHTDIIYYSLLAIDQLELDRNNVEAICTGTDSERKSQLEADLKRFLKVGELPESVVSISNPGLDKSMIAEHFIMFHQHLCV